VVRNNVFSGNGAHDGAGGAWLVGTTFIGNLVAGSYADYGYASVFGYNGAEIRSNTIVRNDGDGIVASQGSSIVAHNIVVRNLRTGIQSFGPTPECNDSWGNGYDYSVLADTTGARNFSADPLFCYESEGDYRINEQSPCAPAGNPGCGIVGAFPIGCGTTAVQPATWGRIKASFRDATR
jgi:hypothetical protein